MNRGGDPVILWLVLRAVSPLALVMVAFAVLGCASGHTVAVQLQTDLLPGLEFDEVLIDVPGRAQARASLRDDYGRPVEIASYRGIARGAHLSVDVALRREGVEVVSRRVERMIDGDTILAVVVTRNCVELACPPAGAPEATECRGGACISPDCEADGSCPSDECTRDAECTASVACVAPRCAEGVCLDTPESSRCAAGEVCSPRLGCVGAETPDAGRPLGLDGDRSDVGAPSNPVSIAVPWSECELPCTIRYCGVGAARMTLDVRGTSPMSGAFEIESLVMTGLDGCADRAYPEESEVGRYTVTGVRNHLLAPGGPWLDTAVAFSLWAPTPRSVTVSPASCTRPCALTFCGERGVGTTVEGRFQDPSGATSTIDPPLTLDVSRCATLTFDTLTPPGTYTITALRDLRNAPAGPWVTMSVPFTLE